MPRRILGIFEGITSRGQVGWVYRYGTYTCTRLIAFCRSNLKIIGIESVFFFLTYYIGSWSSEVVNRLYRVYLGRLPS